MTQTTDSRERVYEILKGFSTAMVVTHGVGGHHKARPMHVAEVQDATGEVLFLTGQGGLAEEIEKEAGVLLVFQNDDDAFLSMRGNARTGHDRARIKEIWKEPYKIWFPKGPEDPEINLVTVELLDAEYWDNRGMNKLEYLFEATKAYLKGQKPDVKDQDQHSKTTL